MPYPADEAIACVMAALLKGDSPHETHRMLDIPQEIHAR